jgi:hypothetical protein
MEVEHFIEPVKQGHPPGAKDHHRDHHFFCRLAAGVVGSANRVENFVP